MIKFIYHKGNGVNLDKVLCFKLEPQFGGTTTLYFYGKAAKVITHFGFGTYDEAVLYVESNLAKLHGG